MTSGYAQRWLVVLSPRISRLKEADQLAAEDENVRRSLAYGREKLAG